MKLRAVLFGILVLSLAAILTLLAPAGVLCADDVSEECTATINGVDVYELNTPGNALEVYPDELVRVLFYAPEPIESYQIKIYFIDIAPFWTISETYNGVDTYFEEDVEVANYAKHGVGLYKVVASADLASGDTCSVDAVYIRVIAGSWMDTTVGYITLPILIVGLLGLVVVLVLTFIGIGPFGGGGFLGGCCGPILPLAVVLTMMAMVTGGAGPGASQTTEAEDKPPVPSGGKDTSGGGKKFRLGIPAFSLGGKKFRPRISILSIGFALLSAIGFVMMFQQMGKVYPTITIVVLSLVLALVAGIVLPTLAMMFSRRRK